MADFSHHLQFISDLSPLHSTLYSPNFWNVSLNKPLLTLQFSNRRYWNKTGMWTIWSTLTFQKQDFHAASRRSLLHYHPNHCSTTMALLHSRTSVAAAQRCSGLVAKAGDWWLVRQGPWSNNRRKQSPNKPSILGRAWVVRPRVKYKTPLRAKREGIYLWGVPRGYSPQKWSSPVWVEAPRKQPRLFWGPNDLLCISK
jgi:hypothetical protein